MQEIVEIREVKPMTIETHIIKLYEDGDLTLSDILNLVDFDNIQEVKNVLEKNF